MPKIFRIQSFLPIAGLLIASVTQAASLSLVGVADTPGEKYSGVPAGQTAPGVSGTMGYGGGLLIDTMVARGLWFEFGGLYLTRKIDTNGQNASPVTDDVTNTFHVLQVPALLKFRLLSFIHVGVGGYWSTGLGGVNSSDATNASDSNSSNTFSGAGFKSTDYGLLGSAGLSLPLGRGGTHLLIEGRYAYGLENVSTGSDTIYNRDLQIVAGFTFPFGRHRQ